MVHSLYGKVLIYLICTLLKHKIVDILLASDWLVDVLLAVID